MEDADIRDLIIRSRSTLLEIIENRGYNVDSYKGVSSKEIDKFATTNLSLLRITAEKKPDGPAPLEQLVALYWMEPMKNKMDTELKKIWDEGEFDHTKQELILVLNEPPHEAFISQAAKQWTLYKARVCFFHLKQIISNPAKHCMVPPHRKLAAEEADFVVKKLKLRTKNELPNIKYNDIQSRVLGLVPGDIVEIRRPSETAGEYTLFRICTI